MSDRLMGASEVIDLIGCGRSTFYKWIRAGRFPPGVKINGLRKWWESKVMDFLRGGAHPVITPPATPTTPSPASATPKPKRKRLAKHVKPKDHSK
jgi:predicted DNA-binding transcriptional regulator AlpA